MRVIWAYSDKGFNKDNFTIGGYKSLYLLQIKRPDIPIPDNAVKLMVTFNQISPVITKGNELFVRHMLVYICKTERLKVTNEEAYNFPMPEHVGFPLEDTADSMLRLEIHYDNPERKSGVLDSSGMELTLVPARRDFDAAVIEIGHLPKPPESKFTQKIPPYQTHFRYQSICRSHCIYDVYPPKNNSVVMKIFAVLLHAHLLARQIIVHQFRNGTKINTIAADRNYDFNYQETVFLKKEIEILRGDDLKVECVYNSMARNQFTFGGLSTRQETCLVYILYYPKMGVTNCLGSIRINDWTWVKKSFNRDNTEEFRKPNVSQEFEQAVNGIGRDSLIMLECFKGKEYSIELKGSEEYLNILQFNMPPTTVLPTAGSSKGGIGVLRWFGLSFASILLYLAIL